MDPDLELALELADVADSLTMRGFRRPELRVELKEDATPVSEVDRAVEEALRTRLARARPKDSVVGEELGSGGGESSNRWILDPIDGTKNFVRGIPVFATLIALEREGEISVGVASAPALGRRWWAARGEGAFADEEPIHVSAVDRIQDAQLCYTSVPGFDATDMADRFLQLARRCARTRGFGDFWQHVLVAEGSADIAAEPDVALWDLAALKVIVEEAGGMFTDLEGVRTAGGGSSLSTNGLLHEAVLKALA